MFSGLSWLIAGRLFANLITLSALPFITRLYGPVEYGGTVLWLLLGAILSSLFSGRYEFAIGAESNDSNSRLLLEVCIALSLLSFIFLTLISVISINFLHDTLIMKFGGQAGVYLLGVYVAFQQAGAALRFWLIRNEQKRRAATATVLSSFMSAISALSLGILFEPSTDKLIIAMLLGSVMHVGCLISSVELKIVVSQSAWKNKAVRLVNVARTFKQYPKTVFAIAIPQALNNHGAAAVLSMVLGTGPAGFMAIARRLVYEPLSLIAGPLWETMHSRISRIKRDSRRVYFIQGQAIAAQLFAWPCVAIYLYSDWVPLVLGMKWNQAPPYVEALAVLAFFNVVSNSTSFFSALGRLKEESIANLVVLVARLGSITLAAAFLDPVSAVWVYVMISSVVYLGIHIYWAISFKVFWEAIYQLSSALLVSSIFLLPLRFLSDDITPISVSALLFSAIVYYIWHGRAWLMDIQHAE